MSTGFSVHVQSLMWLDRKGNVINYHRLADAAGGTNEVNIGTFPLPPHLWSETRENKNGPWNK